MHLIDKNNLIHKIFFTTKWSNFWSTTGQILTITCPNSGQCTQALSVPRCGRFEIEAALCDVDASRLNSRIASQLPYGRFETEVAPRDVDDPKSKLHLSSVLDASDLRQSFF